jgi:hypothetical protein
VLVSHREKLVEVLRRESDGSWARHEGRSRDAVDLASIGCELRVDDVYRDPLAAD